MLIVEHGDAAAARFEHFDYLLKKLVAGIQRLASLVDGILAMFADDYDAVDSEPRAAERESIFDRRMNWNAVALRCRALLLGAVSWVPSLAMGPLE
jgi:hypothetical protein